MKPYADTWPKGTIACLVFALVATAWPSASGWFVGEREALLDGEVWRAWTAHGVHFSWSHLGWSGLLWLVAGGLMECQNRRAWWLGVLLIAPLITGVALIFDPQSLRYGGLSGLACMPVVWLGLDWVRHSRGAHRAVGACVVCAVMAKIAWEFHGVSAAPMLASFGHGAGEVRSAPGAHVAGGLGGALLWLTTFRRYRSAS